MTTLMNVDDYIDETQKRLEKTSHDEDPEHGLSASLHSLSTRSISCSDSISGKGSADSCHRLSRAPPALGEGVGGLFPNMSDRLGIPRDKAISPGRYHLARPCSRRQRQCAKVGGTLWSICTLGQREHLDQDGDARRQRGGRPHRHLRANEEIVRVPVRVHIGRDDRRLRDHSLQRDQGDLEQVREERTCQRG